MDTEKSFLLEMQDHIAVIKFARPKVLNALNSSVLKDFDVLFDQLASDPEVFGVIFMGEGKGFIAGADISEMADLDATEGQTFGALGQAVFAKLEKLSKPTIAAVNGFALGGGLEFAMSCDFRIAATVAKFGQPEVGLGIIPGFGGTQRLPRLVGLSRAKELIYTGGIIDATEAYRIGLVDRVVEAEVLLDTAMELAKKITKNAHGAVALAKKAIQEGYDMDIDDGCDLEADYFGRCFATENQKEGMGAFLRKEKPKFLND
jgi:enoyl-CoA hydratase